MKFLRKLSRLLMDPAERAYFDECANRSPLSDFEFYERFYADTGASKDTVIKVRRLLCEQLRMCQAYAEDNVALVFRDIDIADVCFEIGDEFGLEFPEHRVEKLDGTVDSLIRATHDLKSKNQLDVEPV